MRHVFIVNPVSGKADASLTLVPRIVAACAKADVEYEIRLTDHPGHAEELARAEAEQGTPVRLYACGGDGTLNEVLRGACGYANAAVGCVPCGSGNDFSRNFGERSQFLDLDAQLAGSEQPIDLMSTNAANVSITDTGVAVTVIQHADPVNAETKVTMVCLPSFEAADQVFILDIVAEA